MIRVRDYIVEHAEEIAQIVSLDNGKTVTDAMVAEAFGSAMAANYFAKNTKRLLKDKGIKPALMMLAYKKSKIVRVPWGVVGIISPWNYPFTIPFVEIVMALMAGNAVVLKVATETQQVGRALEKCFSSVGLPEGLFTHVNLPGRIAGEAFLSAGIDKLFFTGSVGVGKELMAMASQTLTPLSLELGGNDPMLVCPDANLYRAATGAVWAGLVEFRANLRRGGAHLCSQGCLRSVYGSARKAGKRDSGRYRTALRRRYRGDDHRSAGQDGQDSISRTPWTRERSSPPSRNARRALPVISFRRRCWLTSIIRWPSCGKRVSGRCSVS